MSLDWDISRVQNYKDICYIYPVDAKGKTKWLNPVTYEMIWATIPVDIGEITDNNWREFYFRLRVWESLKGLENLIKPFDVRNHIGLRTNVFPELTRSQWIKRLMEIQDREITHQIERQLKAVGEGR